MCSLYRMVVFPAASSPSITTRISLFPNSLSNACLNDLNTVCADGAFPIALVVSVATRATASPRRAEPGPSRRHARVLFPPASLAKDRALPAGVRAGLGTPTAPDLARGRLRRAGGTKTRAARVTRRRRFFHTSVSTVESSVKRRSAKDHGVADLARLGNCPYEPPVHFPPPHTLAFSPRLTIGACGWWSLSRGPHTGRARVPRAFPTPETPASVSRRFRRDRDATASVDRDGASTRASLDDADVGFRPIMGAFAGCSRGRGGCAPVPRAPPGPRPRPRTAWPPFSAQGCARGDRDRGRRRHVRR